MKHYAHRDVIKQGQAYMDHVEAMTAEGLHSKSDIAAELAHRDIRIAKLEKVLSRALQFVEVAGDWNFDEAEIDGEMVRARELVKEIRRTLRFED